MDSVSSDLSQERLHGLPASIDPTSVVLILGTLPGQTSLTLGKYYADPTNRFWEILFMACGEQADKTDLTREHLLKKYHIALWDILESAIRQTADDRDLIGEVPNNLPGFLTQHINIKLLLFHSNKAYKYFRWYYKNTTIPYICVSSPSGQNRKAIEDKAAEWRAALSYAIPQLQENTRLAWKVLPHL